MAGNGHASGPEALDDSSESESDSSSTEEEEMEEDVDDEITTDDYEWDEDDTESMKYSTRGFILKAPVLQV